MGSTDELMPTKTTICERLVVGKPNIMDREGFLADVREILDTRIFTNLGPFAIKLESQVCSFLSVKHAFAVSNATVGLAMMLRAIEPCAGGEVIVPAYTFIATAHAVLECGLKPIFCDCDAESHLIGPKEVSAVFTSKTVAIIAVNLWGLACDVEGLQSFADENHVSLLYDSAHSFGARASCGRFVGNFGDAEVFSMHATKLFNSFEGGIVTTNCDHIANRLAPMRNFGITGQDQVSCWGSNYKLSEIHAAFALRQLGKLDELTDQYKENAMLYTRLLNERRINGIEIWNERFLSHEGCTHSYICLEIKPNFPLTRDVVMAKLRCNHIFAKRYFFPGVHKCLPHSKMHGNLKLPVTERLCEEVLVLPTGSTVKQNDIVRIVELLAVLSASHTCEERHKMNDLSEISVDVSHLTSKIAYCKGMKQKFDDLSKACEEEISSLERIVESHRQIFDDHFADL